MLDDLSTLTDRELLQRLARDLCEPIGRAVMNGDDLDSLTEFQEARAPHRLRYCATMKSGAQFNLVTDGPFGWDCESLETSLREVIAIIVAEMQMPSRARH